MRSCWTPGIRRRSNPSSPVSDLVVNAIGVLRSDPDYPGPAYRLRAAHVNAVFPLLLAEAAASTGNPESSTSRRTLSSARRSTRGRADRGVSRPSHTASPRRSARPRRSRSSTFAALSSGRRRVAQTGLWEWFVRSACRARRWTDSRAPWSGRNLPSARRPLRRSRSSAGVFERVRAAGPTHHFVPNEPITKFELLSALGDPRYGPT